MTFNRTLALHTVTALSAILTAASAYLGEPSQATAVTAALGATSALAHLATDLFPASKTAAQAQALVDSAPALVPVVAALAPAAVAAVKAAEKPAS